LNYLGEEGRKTHIPDSLWVKAAGCKTGIMWKLDRNSQKGQINPHELLQVKGAEAVQDYLLREVQRVYRMQGVDINDKHIEVVIRQNLRKVKVEDSGDTELLPGGG